ncbi:uncharacterized protein LOC120326765 [Styela clava]|uniref:uncharacterized protein LOC120326765 n=1 Tax=Styela clava TaxID=7725 RepID=UPI001939715C|nr:uncharacterized protein LOC120326765 [Styela clava]
MKVICAGMSKSGTKTLHVALEELGYSVYDFPEVFDNYEKDFWRFTSKGWTVEDFRQRFENVDAVVDTPMFYFWEELAEAFPDAKVILMTRDNVEAWYKSSSKQMRVLNGWHMYYYPFLSSTWRKYFVFGTNACLLPFGYWTSVYGIESYWPETVEIISKQTYRRHNAHVVHSCPKNRLLVYNCKEGWEPLCEFLGKPVPLTRFPWINKGGEIAHLMWEAPFLKRARKEMITNLSILCVTGIVGAALCFQFKIFK